eukprot:TRINITY_DN1292_c0_g1_i2.p1 TRINITY_DN1292_c0_g1~~TRINITY_DN1292_c0_g1_i2.p1  ORF type:complete len:204 (+),score=36.07 TRINITY_DN1292_c0_g1_i2:874-1485(+)
MRDAALPEVKKAIESDPSLLERDGLYEEVETSGHRSFKGTLLHYSIVFRCPRTVRWLLKQGANTDKKFIHRRRFIGHGTYHGLTPDLLALTTGDPQIYSLFFSSAVSLPQIVEITHMRISGYEKENTQLHNEIEKQKKKANRIKEKHKAMSSSVQTLSSSLQRYNTKLAALLTQEQTPEVQKEISKLMKKQSKAILQLQAISN